MGIELAREQYISRTGRVVGWAESQTGQFINLPQVPAGRGWLGSPFYPLSKFVSMAFQFVLIPFFLPLPLPPFVPSVVGSFELSSLPIRALCALRGWIFWSLPPPHLCKLVSRTHSCHSVTVQSIQGRPNGVKPGIRLPYLIRFCPVGRVWISGPS
jgi:hypothetical protein